MPLLVYAESTVRGHDHDVGIDLRVIAIDIPIGLPDTGVRQADPLVRYALGVGACRFVGDVMLGLPGGRSTERASLQMVCSKSVPFPPEPLTSVGVNLVRRSMDRADRRQGRRNLLLKGPDAVGMGFSS